MGWEVRTEKWEDKHDEGGMKKEGFAVQWYDEAVAVGGDDNLVKWEIGPISIWDFDIESPHRFASINLIMYSLSSHFDNDSFCLYLYSSTSCPPIANTQLSLFLSSLFSI